MKKITFLTLLGLISLNFSCADEVTYTEDNQEFLDELSGIYTLTKIDFETAVDLDADGDLGSNLFEEYISCEWSIPLGDYQAKFHVNINIENKSVVLEVPFSHYDGLSDQQTSCMRPSRIDRQIEIDYGSKTISLASNAYEEDFFYSTFQTKVIDVVWDNRIIYATIEKEFFTPNEEWETVILEVEYEWQTPE